MSKALLTTLLALSALACGDYEGIEYNEYGEPELGQSIEALTVPSRYGRGQVGTQSTAVENRCVEASNPCNIPKDKIQSFRVDWDDIEEDTWWLWPGAEDDFFEGITNGVINAQEMAGSGWVVDMGGTQTSEQISMGPAQPTEVWGRSPISQLTNKTVGGRNFVLIGRCSVELYAHLFTWNRAELNLTRAETISMIQYTVEHEIGHCLGLGHQVGTKMRGHYAALQTISPVPWSADEQARVRGYVP